MDVLDQMGPAELEAFAAKLHAQIVRSVRRCDMPNVELEDVKGWIASRKKEPESYSELSFFLNLL
jgi:SH3-like domain-containing protein